MFFFLKKIINLNNSMINFFSFLISNRNTVRKVQFKYYRMHIIKSIDKGVKYFFFGFCEVALRWTVGRGCGSGTGSLQSCSQPEICPKTKENVSTLIINRVGPDIRQGMPD